MHEHISKQNLELDLLPIGSLVQAIFLSQKESVERLSKELHILEPCVDRCVQLLETGGRLIFIGAGTSGRLCANEAAELFPTFSWPKKKSLVFIAGGTRALYKAVEGAEDNTKNVAHDLKKIKLSSTDICILVSSSGDTPFVVSALQYAKKIGALTIGISNNVKSKLNSESQFPIFLNTEKEVIIGSSRLNAGTCQKIILNVLTTAMMTKLGRVYKNYMVEVVPSNKKLINRSIDIVRKIIDVDEKESKYLLKKTNGNIKLSCIFHKTKKLDEAKKILKKNKGNLRKSLQEVSDQ